MSDVLPLFLRPEWWLALLPLPLVLWLLGRRHTRDPWAGIIDAALLVHLRAGTTPARWWRLAAVTLAWCCAVFALAGPSWQRSPATQHRDGGALVVLLDLSLSMYARDVAPSRVARARQEIEDLAREFTGGRVALIAYAGDAHVVTPLTEDARTVVNLLAALEPSVMPLPGADLAAALRLAKDVLQGSGEYSGGVVVVTDEIQNLADLGVFDDARFPISVVGVGTAAGGTIPLDFTGERGRQLTDAQGVPVMPQVDHARLAEAAQMGGGAYATAVADRADTNALLAAVGRHATRPATEQRSARLQWQDQGYWLVLLLLPLCAYGFRRGVVAALPLALALLLGNTAPPIHAANASSDASANESADATTAATTAGRWRARWEQLWSRADQRGYSALYSGRPDLAALLFRDDAWRATALYRSGRYADAAALFRRDSTADGAFNLGNALAKSGDIAAALAAYERALALDPAHADARFNRDLLRRRRPPEPPSEQPNQGSQSRRGGARDATPRADPDATAGLRRDAQPNPSAERAREQARRDDQAQRGDRPLADESPRERAERQRATEQWLRRVPDVPGALLRRKFAAETAMREARGELPPAPDRPW